LATSGTPASGKYSVVVVCLLKVANYYRFDGKMGGLLSQKPREMGSKVPYAFGGAFFLTLLFFGITKP
jgi:hypothetical protein